jgi:zinc protease
MDFNDPRNLIKYHRRVCSNGLVVIVIPHPETALVAVNVLYRTGARDEDPERTGMAHLMEHLMFSGTARFPVFDLPIARAGGVNNAFTNHDVTNYYIVLPVDQLELALQMEADRMVNLVPDPKKVEVQKGVVVEEFRQRYLNQPYGDLNHLLAAAAYKKHPYRWPTIGLEPAHIEAMTPQHVADFYRARYSPANAILAISGDVDPDAVFQMVDGLFGVLTGPAPEVPERLAEPALQRAERVVVHREVPSSYLTVAFPVPECTHPDFTALMFLADILGQGIISRLHIELVNRIQLCSRVYAGLSGTADPGLFTISGMLIDGVSSDETTQAIQKSILTFQQDGPTPSEMRSIINGSITQTLVRRQGVMNLAMDAAYAEFEGDVQRMNTQLAEMARVVPDDIVAMAQRYLRPENRIEVHYLKKI